ncbi:MAG: dihydrodipicolinate reductase, partial [Ilumatobacteraceae bacterium]|nr:dihydrodipicolinate reductase [Ilumatobacteraceae bacterium]
MSTDQRDHRPLRIVQWTTGNVGERSVIAIAANPLLELVGCFAWSADKVGRDVGELCGIPPMGVVATAGFITGHALGDGRARVQAACVAGGT